jgi:TrmH family RNA methyltransferase
MTLITSFANQNVKLVRKLEQKKYRQETGLFFIEGLRTVGEAVQTGASIETLVIAPDLLISDFGKSLLKQPAVENIEKLEVSSEIYRKIAHKEGPQGIGAIVKQEWKVIDQILVNSGDLWVALDSVSDPGNLGTIMRTAEAVSCRGIILLGQSTDPYDPTAVKASMGAVFSLELVQSDWDSFNNWKNINQLTMVGTSDSAKTDYQKVAYQRPLILLMGSERHGLSEQMQSDCDHMVFIPMEGRTDSLNLAVATGILLYEIYNQTRILESVKS